MQLEQQENFTIHGPQDVYKRQLLGNYQTEEAPFVCEQLSFF